MSDHSHPRSIQRWFALSGMLVPVIFAGLVILLGLLEPGYDHRRQMMSICWKRYSWFTLAMGILANIPGLILWTSFFTVRISEWEGVIQRLGIFFPLLWVEIMAIKLLKSSI